MSFANFTIEMHANENWQSKNKHHVISIYLSTKTKNACLLTQIRTTNQPYE